MKIGKHRMINEGFYSSETLRFDSNGECHDRRGIANAWMSVCKYPNDSETKVLDGTTYLYCIALTPEWSSHFWAVYPGNDNPRDAEKHMPEYLIKRIPVAETRKHIKIEHRCLMNKNKNAISFSQLKEFLVKEASSRFLPPGPRALHDLEITPFEEITRGDIVRREDEDAYVVLNKGLASEIEDPTGSIESGLSDGTIDNDTPCVLVQSFYSGEKMAVVYGDEGVVAQYWYGNINNVRV